MRILFLSYWPLQDPLTSATVLPHLRLLQERADIEAVLLVTIERNATSGTRPTLKLPFPAHKITFEPLISQGGRSVLVNKTDDFLRFPRKLVEHVKAFRANFILARGAPAGSLAYLVWKQLKLPYYVESFEPHAEYMRESGVWRWFDPRYIFQQYWENQQKRSAQGLMPVAENYRRRLLAEGVPPERVVTVPCSVNLTDFAFRPAAREQLRQQLGIQPEAMVGVYVGKFGGMYYDAEAFQLFRETADYFGTTFYLLILSPQPATELWTKLNEANMDNERVSVVFVPFDEVPNYLSAADFAFGLHRPLPYVSPIKVGEYWASGLPVLLTEGVGDDSDIIQQESGGALFNLSQPGSVNAALRNLQTILGNPDHRQNVRELAVRYRSIEGARAAYKLLF